MKSWKDVQFKNLNRAKVLRNSGSYVILAMALGAMTFFGICTPRGSGLFRPMGSAAVVGDEVITANDFRRAYQSAYNELQQEYKDNFDPAAFNLSKLVLDRLINERVLYAYSQKNGIYPSDKQLERLIAEFEFFQDERKNFSGEKFDNYLKAMGLKEAAYLDMLRREVAIRQLQSFISETYFISSKQAEWDYRTADTKLNIEFLKIDGKTIQPEVSQQEIQDFLSKDGKNKVNEYFNKNQQEFNKPERVKARHILVAHKDARNASQEAKSRTKEQARNRAADILKKVQISKSEFAKVASQETDEVSGKVKGGDLGWFDRQTMVKEFTDVAFKLKVGELSGIVESPFGFHIIKVEDRQDEIKETLEAATEKIAKSILQKDKKPKLIQARAELLLTKLKDKAALQNELKQFNLEWKESGEFALDSQFIPNLGSDKEFIQAVLRLKNPGQIYEQLIDKGDIKYIVRLKSRKEPNMSKFDEKKKEELIRSTVYQNSFMIFRAIHELAKKQYEDEGKIWRNNDYLLISQKQAGQPAEEGG